MAAASMGGDDGSGFGGFGVSEGRGGGSLLGLLGLAADGRLRSRPRGRPYSRTAYEAAPRIRQGGAPLRVALSPAAAYGVFGGAAAAAFLLFLAGFLAAFWLVAPNGAPNGALDGPPVATRAPAPAVAAPEAGAAAGGLIPRATAGDAPETRAPPAPEIAAAERAMAPRVETPQLAAAPSAAAPATEAPPPGAPATGAPATGASPSGASTSRAPAASEGAPAAPRARLKPLFGDAGGGVARDAAPVEDMSAEPPEPPAAAASTGFTTPAASAAPGAAAGAAYELQFGAFRDRANADALLTVAPESLGARLVESRDATGRPLYYIRAGGFDSAAEARAASARIEREAGLKSFVRRDAGAR